MPEYRCLVPCMAPSKSVTLAGMMISNIIIRDEKLRKRWLDRHYNFDNPLSIAAAQGAYEKGEPWVQELRAYLDENFRFTEEYLKEHLPQAVFRISEATYLAWVNVGAYFEPEEPHFSVFCLQGRRSFGRRNYVCTKRRRLYPPEPGLPQKGAGRRAKKDLSGSAGKGWKEVFRYP